MESRLALGAGAVVMRFIAVLVAALAMLAAAPAAEAHRRAASGDPPPAGVAIPSLTHGQMTVIARNLSAIRALANRQVASDMTMWRLEDYLSLQSFACLWGLVPGSVTDEASPFNECSHAYLAAARALLLHLRTMPRADHEAVEALIRQIETEMLMNDASLALCRYSDEPFNTNEIVMPRFSEIAFHPPTLAAVSAFLLAIAAPAWGFWPRRQAGVHRERTAA